MNQEQFSKLSFQIMTEFEEFLNERDITIPDEHRDGNEEEARIYGSSYYELEEYIEKTLKQYVEVEQ